MRKIKETWVKTKKTKKKQKQERKRRSWKSREQNKGKKTGDEDIRIRMENNFKNHNNHQSWPRNGISKLSSPFLVYLEWYQPVRGTFSYHKLVMVVTILQQVYLTPSSKRFNRTLTLKFSTKSFTHLLTPTLPKTDSSVTCWQKLSHPLNGGNFLTGSMNETWYISTKRWQLWSVYI